MIRERESKINGEREDGQNGQKLHRAYKVRMEIVSPILSRGGVKSGRFGRIDVGGRLSFTSRL